MALFVRKTAVETKICIWGLLNTAKIIWWVVFTANLAGYILYIARWIKFEEDVEEGGERWSKPHVATLSLHHLFELRSCISTGTIILDMEVDIFPQMVGEWSQKSSLCHSIVKNAHSHHFVIVL